MPAVLRFLVRSSIGPAKVSAADDGPIELTISVMVPVTASGSPTRPTIDTSAINAGKMDSTE
jgi:hypothetical protein